MKVKCSLKVPRLGDLGDPVLAEATAVLFALGKVVRFKVWK